MFVGDDFLNSPELDLERWRDALLRQSGRYTPVAKESEAFTGRALARSIYGFVSVELSCNAHRVERTQRDIRIDGMDHYFALFQIAGASTILQNDRVVQPIVGDIALVDSARPGTYISEGSHVQWFSLQLPRRSLVSCLGFEPQGGILRRGETVAGSLLFNLVQGALTTDTPAFSETYMQLAVYDLIGALIAPSGPAPVSPHAEKLFKRICDIVRGHFANPNFGPCEVAAEAGISLRYLQKLFATQSTTCSHFIDSVRLHHAARLLCRRQLLGTRQPISEIAYACGFADYTNFARKFRRCFGHAPGFFSATATIPKDRWDDRLKPGSR
jgi:AraC family transcriptional activator of tynA and feaB